MANGADSHERRVLVHRVMHRAGGMATMQKGEDSATKS